MFITLSTTLCSSLLHSYAVVGLILRTSLHCSVRFLITPLSTQLALARPSETALGLLTEHFILLHDLHIKTILRKATKIHQRIIRPTKALGHKGSFQNTLISIKTFTTLQFTTLRRAVHNDFTTLRFSWIPYSHKRY